MSKLQRSILFSVVVALIIAAVIGLTSLFANDPSEGEEFTTMPTPVVIEEAPALKYDALVTEEQFVEDVFDLAAIVVKNSLLDYFELSEADAQRLMYNIAMETQKELASSVRTEFPQLATGTDSEVLEKFDGKLNNIILNTGEKLVAKKDLLPSTVKQRLSEAFNEMNALKQ